jgi:hypothetical protein
MDWFNKARSAPSDSEMRSYSENQWRLFLYRAAGTDHTYA